MILSKRSRTEALAILPEAGQPNTPYSAFALAYLAHSPNGGRIDTGRVTWLNGDFPPTLGGG